MNIVFRKTRYTSDPCEPKESHAIVVDGKVMMGQCDWICPEDVRFYRDLTSPLEAEDIIKLAYIAGKQGEEVVFSHEEIETDED